MFQDGEKRKKDKKAERQTTETESLNRGVLNLEERGVCGGETGRSGGKGTCSLDVLKTKQNKKKLLAMITQKIIFRAYNKL